MGDLPDPTYSSPNRGWQSVHTPRPTRRQLIVLACLMSVWRPLTALNRHARGGRNCASGEEIGGGGWQPWRLLGRARRARRRQVFFLNGCRGARLDPL